MPSSGCQKCARSEEHTSELQSHSHLVCRLLLEKKNYRTCGPSSRLRAAETASRATSSTASRGGSLRTFFFFNDTATTEFYPLSLHNALPICLNSSHTLISYAVFCLRDESVTGVQ